MYELRCMDKYHCVARNLSNKHNKKFQCKLTIFPSFILFLFYYSLDVTT